MFYPDHYNGAFAACPDPIDFHAYTTINLYKDKNAFYPRGRPQARRAAGACATTWATSDHRLERTSRTSSHWATTAVRANNRTSGRPSTRRSALTATRSRSSTSAPARSITDVADYWREHYDLDAILERDWATLGPKLAGKNPHLRRQRRHLLPERRRLPAWKTF